MNNLEELFDNATFESNINGDDREFNAVKITKSHPCVNGFHVSVLHRVDLDVFIAQLISPKNAVENNYEYIKPSKVQIEAVMELDFDPSNDGLYAKELLEIFEM